ncbi:MAG: nucleotidyltransferase domain-containing protein [Nitrospirota bacterium]
MNNQRDFKEKMLNQVPLKIFSYLCRVPHIPHFGREIARTLNVSIGATNQTLNLLLSMGVVTREKKGQLYLYRVIADNPVVKEFKKFENTLDLMQLILKIKGISNKIVLYGSCATGEDTIESDIDVFIISKEKEKVIKEIRKEAKRFKREIKTVIVSIEEYISMRNKKEVLLEEVDKGIVLYEKKG